MEGLTLRERYRELKYRIADTLFAYELDEAYRHGIKEGARNALGDATVKISIRQQNLTPARAEGAQQALDIIERTKLIWKSL